MPHIMFEETSIKVSDESMPYAAGILATIVIDSKSNLKYEFRAQQEHETQLDVLERAPNEIRLNFGPELLNYLNGHASIIGTPIETVSAITKAQCESLKTCGIYTVEDLADNAATPRIEHMGAVAQYLQGIARKYLNDMRGVDAKDSEIEALKAEIEALKAQSEPKNNRK